MGNVKPFNAVSKSRWITEFLRFLEMFISRSSFYVAVGF